MKIFILLTDGTVFEQDAKDFGLMPGVVVVKITDTYEKLFPLTQIQYIDINHTQPLGLVKPSGVLKPR